MAVLSIPEGDLSLVAGARVLVALSGGPDSTALLLWLLDHEIDAAAFHFDHALRPGSDSDARHVADLCRRLGVELITERRQAPLAPGSLQAAARQARYAAFDGALTATGRELIALGHTADDVVEGALLHLLRGSGLAGLRGMPASRGRYIRPLLKVWRRDIEAYLQDKGVATLRDPSNEEADRFARARIRHELLPRLERDRPGLSRHIFGAAQTASRLQAALEASARALTPEIQTIRAQQAAVRMEFYRYLYGQKASLPALSSRHLRAMDDLLTHGRTGQSLDLPSGLRFRLLPGTVSIGVGPTKDPLSLAQHPPPLVVRHCETCRDPNAAHLKPGLSLTTAYRRPGLRMRPQRGAGQARPHTRKLQDILTDARVPRHQRDQLPLVFADGRLAFVPGIAVDADAAARPGAPALHVSFLDWPQAQTGM
jgi:tRNA(Ile)-lysidine synthase